MLLWIQTLPRDYCCCHNLTPSSPFYTSLSNEITYLTGWQGHRSSSIYGYEKASHETDSSSYFTSQITHFMSLGARNMCGRIKNRPGCLAGRVRTSLKIIPWLHVLGGITELIYLPWNLLPWFWYRWSGRRESKCLTRGQLFACSWESAQKNTAGKAFSLIANVTLHTRIVLKAMKYVHPASCCCTASD